MRGNRFPNPYHGIGKDGHPRPRELSSDLELGGQLALASTTGGAGITQGPRYLSRVFSGSLDDRVLLRRMLVIAGLSAVAVAGPVLDLYGRNPEVFVANRTSPVEIIAFGLIIALAIPVVSLALMMAARGIGDRAERFVYLGLVGVLGLAVGMVVGRQIFPASTAGALAAAVAVAVVVFGLHRWMRGVLAFFAVALPLVLVLFVATSASARLVWSASEPEQVGGVVGSSAPLVFIQLDEFPLASIVGEDGEINGELFPNFARLATEGSWYRNALSDSIATTQSVPAILTGRLGEKGMSPSSVDHPDNLFTLLADDYEMHVIEWVAEMCPEDICPEYAGRAPARFTSLLVDVGVVYGHLTLPPPARESLPSIDNSWKGFLGQDARSGGTGVAVPGLPVPSDPMRVEWVNWMQRIINGIGDDASPILHYAHLKSPHVPWATNPSGTHYSRPEEYTEVEGVGGDGHWGPDAEPARLGFQRHLFQIGLLDTMFGRLFDRLEETGTWDETMIVVVADHGASFVPGEHRRWPYENNRDDLYRVPLLVKYPGQTDGQIVDEPVFGIDILPTIVEVLDVETDWEFDGVSLLHVEGSNRLHTPVHWCCNGDGASTEVETLWAQVARNHEWIPDQSSWTKVAAAGPLAPLVGRSMASIDVSGSDDFTWSLDDPLQDVDRTTGVVQTLITGRVELPEEVVSDEALVIVNGGIAGVGFISRDSASGGTIRAMIAEETLVDGRNDVEILIANPDGGWYSGTSDVITLDLITEDGRLLELRPEGSRRLQVDRVLRTEGGWRVEGWAADVTRKVTPDTFYVFAGEALVAWGEPNVENRNVVRWFGSDDLLMSGFSFNFTTELVPEALEQFTVVAEFDSYAIGEAAPIRRDP